MSKAAFSNAAGGKGTPLSLSEFVVAHRQACFACTIPEAEEVNEGRRNGVKTSTILRWLVEARGYAEATRNKLDHHFGSRHHEKKPA
jgi:hypothetical protein